MIVTYIRSSSYNQWDYCQMSYFMTYVLGHYGDSNKKAEIGTVCHKVFECLAALKKDLQEREKSKSKRKNLVIKDDAIGEFKLNVDEFFSDGYISTLLDKSFDYYSSISTHDWDNKDKSHCMDLIKGALSYNNCGFDPRNRTIVAPEAHFDIPIEEDWAKFSQEIDGKTVEGRLAIKGTIDLVTEVNEDTIEVVDWKTGRRLDWATGEEKDFNKLMDDAQLLLYHYAISKLFPQYKYIIMTIFFIKDDPVGNRYAYSLPFEEEDYGRFLGMLKDRYTEILKNTTPQPLDRFRNDFRCKRLCHFYKNNWPGTDETMCHHVERNLKVYGIEKTIEKCKKPGFSVGYYSAPG